MLGNYMKFVLRQNGLLGGDYVEVYAGGAAIAWMLLFEGYVQKVHINDLNRSVYAFWSAVLYQTEDLCKLIRDVTVTMEEWKRQKAIQSDPYNHTILELGFSTFFLNRTNRAGIIKGGVIGGKEQAGIWRLNARFNKMDLIDRIKRIARYASHVFIYNQDAVEFITQILPFLPNKILIYFDPPYYVKGKGLYEDHYDYEDHVKIAKLITKKVKQPWIVSYDADPQILKLYANCRCIKYDLSYSVKKRYAGSEIMFFYDKLFIPPVVHPARVKKVSSAFQKQF